MSTGGLSVRRLSQMREVMALHVESGEVTGLVTLVSRRGETHVDAVGMTSLSSQEPLRRDTIFRIASLTKPVAAVAAMILVEECKIRLDDPVDRFLPELAGRRVLKRLDGPLDETVPARRPITLRDLLTLRMGFGYLMSAAAMEYPIVRAATELELFLGAPQPQRWPAPDEWLARFASLPLMHQPGEVWMYDVAIDVLGVLIARVAGQPLEGFLQDRIFAPLGMKDTGFSVSAKHRSRMATSYSTDPETGKLALYDDVTESQWAKPPAFPSAAGGLVSTVDDYFAFGQMMLDKGALGHERILSRPAVELMTANQLTAEQRAAASLFLGEDAGWGMGMAVTVGRGDIMSVPGRFGWDGGLGTSWRTDPAERLVGLLFTQSAWTSPEPPAIWRDFWTSVYQAIDD
ncbi:MAG: serine hydrolase domain-containing protein [Phyllobacterium sp.]